MLWKATVQIACVKVDPDSRQIESYKFLSLKQFLRVFKTFQSHLQVMVSSERQQVDTETHFTLQKFTQLRNIFFAGKFDSFNANGQGGMFCRSQPHRRSFWIRTASGMFNMFGSKTRSIVAMRSHILLSMHRTVVRRIVLAFFVQLGTDSVQLCVDFITTPTVLLGFLRMLLPQQQCQDGPVDENNSLPKKIYSKSLFGLFCLIF